MRQYIPENMISNTHKITVSVIGAGGTGSLLMDQLGRIHTALVGLDKKGLHVKCFDPDKVEPANLGRQKFTAFDINNNKADVLVSKINMFYGTQWESFPMKVTKKESNWISNIIFICVDNIESRKEIYEKAIISKFNHEYENHYIIDCGNEFKTGQVYLSNSSNIIQPESKYETIAYIQNPFEKYGKNVYTKDKTNVPSCSLAQAIGKQDLMINQFIADSAAKLFWDMLRNLFISYNEIYVNLTDGIKIQTNKL
jgi:PRTRC genetic system ThiF family protein